MTAIDEPVVQSTEPPFNERTAWLALAVVMGATVMVALDLTIVNVALHDIGRDLNAGEGIEWVVTGYLLAVCVSQPASGWLADRFGRRAMFRTTLAAFALASFACALAPNLDTLIIARVLQGLGGGALMPVGMAIVLGLFPKERHGRAIAVWGMAAMLAPAVGPSLGGWLVTSVSWHWLFLINVPIGAVTFAFSLRLIPETGHRERRPFDGLGLLLGCGGLTLAVLGLSEANRWGWGTVTTLGCIGVGLASLGAFVRWELRATHPMIELRMFRERSFRFAMGALLFVYIAQFGRLVFLPLQLEELRGISALRVGLLFLPAGVFTAVGMQLGGKLVDRIGPRLPIMVGSAMVGVAMVGFAFLRLDTPLLWIDTIMCVQGFGIGLLTAPAMVAGLSELPPHLMAQGTAMRSLLGQVGGALAVAILGAVVALRAGGSVDPSRIQAGYDAAFAAAAVGVGFAFLLAARLPKRVERVTGATPDEGALLVLE